MPDNNHSATTQGAFTKSIVPADEILAKTPEYYSALDVKGLAVSGLVLCDGRSAAMLRPHIDDAIETFQKARNIVPHARVVKSVLRLFDELVKCDEEGVLKEVREVIAGS